MLWEVFVRRFEDAFEQYERGRLTGEEAGELLGMSGRNFRRLCVRYEEDGIEGLRNRRLEPIRSFIRAAKPLLRAFWQRGTRRRRPLSHQRASREIDQ
jgi:hypothetical protein